MVNLDDLRRVSTRQAVNVAGFILIFGCLFAMASVVVIGVMGNFDALWIAALVFAGFGFAAFAAGLAIFGLNIWHSREIVQRGITLLDREIARRLPAPEPTPSTLPDALPALPAENETIRVTVNGRGGEISRETIAGFDPRDLAYLFRALARGEKWTENNMEKWELPYSHEIMGKAQVGTPYYNFVDLCVRAEIIGGREPKKSGTLLVTDPAEMMRLVKALDDSQSS